MTFRFALVFSVFFSVASTNAQKLLVSEPQIEEGKVSLVATIEASHSPRERYNLYIYSSVNSYARPISYKVTDMIPGQAYPLSFDGGEEIGSFEGELQFRFEIEASRFPLKIETEKSKFRRGKSLALDWSDYHGVGPYQVELWQNNQLQEVLASRVTETNCEVLLPKKLEKGNDYDLRVKALANSEMDTEQMPVTIQGKYGIAVKILPVLAVGGVVPLILTSGDPKGIGELSDPPGPPSN